MLLNVSLERHPRRFCLTEGFSRPTQCFFLGPEQPRRIEFLGAQTAQICDRIGVLTRGKRKGLS
jgi:hypothetical protein